MDNVLTLDAAARFARSQRLVTARTRYETAATELATAERKVVAEILRELLPGAAELTVNKYVDDNDQTQVTMLLVTDVAGEVLWFSRDHMNGNAKVAGLEHLPKLHWKVRTELQMALADAYDADSGVFGIAWSEDLGDFENPLSVDLAKAVAA